MLDIRCPSCGRESAVSEKYAGTELICPDCQQPFIAGSVRAGTTAEPGGPPHDPSLVGISGWLILPAIGLVLGPLLNGFGILQSLGALVGPDAAALEGEFPGFTMVVLVEIVLSVGLFFFQLTVAYVFFGKRAATPRFMVALLLVNIALNVIDAGLFVAVLETMSPEVFGSLVRSVIGAAIWIPYFLTSRRVKATFVNP